MSFQDGFNNGLKLYNSFADRELQAEQLAYQREVTARQEDRAERQLGQSTLESDHRMEMAGNRDERENALSAKQIENLTSSIKLNQQRHSHNEKVNPHLVTRAKYEATTAKNNSDISGIRADSVFAKSFMPALTNLLHDDNGKQRSLVDIGRSDKIQAELMTLSNTKGFKRLFQQHFGEGRTYGGLAPIRDAEGNISGMTIMIDNANTNSYGPMTEDAGNDPKSKVVPVSGEEFSAFLNTVMQMHDKDGAESQQNLRDMSTANPALRQTRQKLSQLGSVIPQLTSQVEAAQTAFTEGEAGYNAEQEAIDAQIAEVNANLKRLAGEAEWSTDHYGTPEVNRKEQLAAEEELQRLQAAKVALTDGREADRRKLGQLNNALTRVNAQQGALADQQGVYLAQNRLSGSVGTGTNMQNMAHYGTPHKPSRSGGLRSTFKTTLSFAKEFVGDAISTEVRDGNGGFRVDKNAVPRAQNLVAQYIDTTYGGDIDVFNTSRDAALVREAAIAAVDFPEVKTLAPLMFKVSAGWSNKRFKDEVELMPAIFDDASSQKAYLEAIDQISRADTSKAASVVRHEAEQAIYARLQG